MYSFIPVSGCLGMGPSAPCFPGAYNSVKTALFSGLTVRKHLSTKTNVLEKQPIRTL